MFISAKTEKGNIGRSNVSQEIADEQAKCMDRLGCVDCDNCENCIDCIDCKNCTSCKDCLGCVSCGNCINCVDCENCYVCNSCRECTACVDCDNSLQCKSCNECVHCSSCSNCRKVQFSFGILHWNGPTSSQLIAIQGLQFEIAFSSERLQIGCKNYGFTKWRSFSEDQLKDLSPLELGDTLCSRHLKEIFNVIEVLRRFPRWAKNKD